MNQCGKSGTQSLKATAAKKKKNSLFLSKIVNLSQGSAIFDRNENQAVRKRSTACSMDYTVVYTDETSFSRQFQSEFNQNRKIKSKINYKCTYCKFLIYD